MSTRESQQRQPSQKRDRSPPKGDPPKTPRTGNKTNLQPKAIALVGTMDRDRVEPLPDLQAAYESGVTKGWSHMCGPKCSEPNCPYIRAPDDICRSMAKHGHCKFHFFGMLQLDPATGSKYDWAGGGCKRFHYVVRQADNNKIEWYRLKEGVPRLACADSKCASQEAWIKFYDSEHDKDVKARLRGEEQRAQRATTELLKDSVKVQAFAAQKEKIQARREGADYDPVERAKGVVEHLNALNQTKADAGKKPKFNLFANKKK